MIGLDSLMDTSNQKINRNRVLNLREELMNAGIPASKINTGSFGAKHMDSDRSVKVMVCR